MKTFNKFKLKVSVLVLLTFLTEFDVQVLNVEVAHESGWVFFLEFASLVVEKNWVAEMGKGLCKLAEVHIGSLTVL